jgi:hypothetical protein
MLPCTYIADEQWQHRSAMAPAGGPRWARCGGGAIPVCTGAVPPAAAARCLTRPVRHHGWAPPQPARWKQHQQQRSHGDHIPTSVQYQGRRRHIYGFAIVRLIPTVYSFTSDSSGSS